MCISQEGGAWVGGVTVNSERALVGYQHRSHNHVYGFYTLRHERERLINGTWHCNVVLLCICAMLIDTASICCYNGRPCDLSFQAAPREATKISVSVQFGLFFILAKHVMIKVSLLL